MMKSTMMRLIGVVASGAALAACGTASDVNGHPGLATTVGASASPAPAASSGAFGTVTWKEFGPVHAPGGASGKLVAFAHDPTNPKVMYVGSANSGIYGTTDGGVTWSAMDNGIVDSSGYTATGTRDLTVDPAQPSTVLAATSQQIYRSTNSGASWSPVGPAGQAATQFAWSGTKVYAATNAGVLVSADDGATWTVSLPNPTGSSAAAAVTAVGDLVVAGFNGSKPLEFLVNGTWVARGTPAGTAHQIAVDPFNTNVIYVARSGGSYNYALSASNDGGLTWTDNITYPELGAQAIAFSTVTPNRLYYGGDAGPVLYIDNAQTISTSPTYGQGFVADGGNGDKQHIVVEPNAAGTDDQCWVASDQGLFSSSTCSARTNPTGSALTVGLINYLVTDFALTSSGNGAVVQLQDYGSTATADGGSTWTSAHDGEDGAAAVNPGNDNWCYSWTRRSTTGCNSFTATTTTGMGGQPITNPGVFAFDPTNPTTMYVAAGGVIWRSTDGGATYANAGWGFTNATVVRIDPNNGQHIAVIAGGVLNQSTDGGTTWTTSTRTGLGQVEFIAGYPGVILAVAGQSVLKSTDGGVTFNATNITSDGGVFQMTCASGPDPMCAIASNNQLLASADQGSTWQRIDQNTITHKFTSVHFLNGYLYAGTYGQGIIRTAQPLTPVTSTPAPSATASVPQATPSAPQSTPTASLAKPSVPRSIHLSNGPSGGALTTIATWQRPATANPPVTSYEVRIQGRSPKGAYTRYRYVILGGSATRLNIAGTRGYLYRVEVIARNSVGFGPWSSWSNFAYPR